MDIDLGQILLSNSVPDGTLENAWHLLEDSLPTCRRDLAYSLANIRRIEQKYKQAQDEIDRYDRALEIDKQEVNPDRVQVISSDRQNAKKIILKLKQEYEVLTQKALALKDKISETEQQILKLKAKRKSQRAEIQKAQRRKYYYMALGVIDSTFLVNAIEYPVIQESILQHAQLPIDIRIKFKSIEVAAFALNRLPSMYASTMEDYDRHLLAVHEMKLKISDTVKRAIKSLRMGDPLYDSTPIPDQIFCDLSGLLGCLCLVFNRNLGWSDVPKLLLKIKEQRSPVNQSISSTANYARPEIRQNHAASHVQKYLQRSKLRKNNYEGEESPKNSQIQEKFLELYTIRGRLKYINAMEKLTVAQTFPMLVDIFDDTSNYAQIIAQTLNQATPMYATTERGLNHLCKQFFETQAAGIKIQISANTTKFRYQSPSKANPIYFQQFNREYLTALGQIENILNRPNLTPDDLVGAIAEFVTGS